MNTYPKFVSNVSIFLSSDFSARFRGWQECQKRLKILAYLPLKNPKSPTRFHQDPTFSITLSPTFNDRIRNVFDEIFEPSASSYVFSPKKSEASRVPVRMRVITTSDGMLTSDAPL